MYFTYQETSRILSSAQIEKRTQLREVFFYDTHFIVPSSSALGGGARRHARLLRWRAAARKAAGLFARRRARDCAAPRHGAPAFDARARRGARINAVHREQVFARGHHPPRLQAEPRAAHGRGAEEPHGGRRRRDGHGRDELHRRAKTFRRRAHARCADGVRLVDLRRGGRHGRLGRSEGESGRFRARRRVRRHPRHGVHARARDAAAGARFLRGAVRHARRPLAA